MKKLKFNTLYVAITALIGLSAMAHTPPIQIPSEEMPIASEAMLDAYAMSIVKDADVNMWANSAIASYWTNVPYTGKVADPVALSKLAAGITPVITIANPQDDAVNYYVAYNGGVGNVRTLLFYGYDSKKPLLGKWGWGLPTFSIVPQRSDWIPFQKKGLQNAYMVIRDENGNVVDYYYFSQDGRLDAANGILYLGSQHVNRLGELYTVSYDNGTNRTEVYNLRNGRRILPETVFGNASVEFARLVVLPENASVIKYKAVIGAPQLYYVEYTKETDTVVAFDAPEGETVKIFVIDAESLPDGPDAWNQIKLGTYTIEKGRRLFFRFDWGEPNTAPIPNPWEGGDKG